MISNPRPGQLVRIAYAARRRKVPGLGLVGFLCSWAPFHGHRGRVLIRGIGRRARNHGVEVDDRLVVIPAGQLLPIQSGD
jgi:hypothetical protein